MHFLKEKDNKSFLTEELKGNITNNFKFSIKDLYKKEIHRIQSNVEMLDCLDCGMFLSGPFCAYCGVDSQQKINQNTVKNWSVQRQCQEEQVSIQCMILMVDISGSMNITYPSTYQKINRQYIIRVIGIKNFDILKSAIGEQQVVNNFKGIQTLMQTGQTIKNIAWTLKDQIIRQRKLNRKPLQKNKEEIIEYISRKQIIEFGVAHYVNTIKTKRPNTVITVVYFNANIEYPVNNFIDIKVVGNIDTKTLEEMIQEGKLAAQEISLSNINEIGDSLITNMTKAEAQGPTAMTPCLAFCLGMAAKWKHDLHQIVIVTDGLSNVGFGQTEQQSQLQKSKIIFEQLANKYAIKSNCVVNIISFQECAIGYDVIDEIIKRTGGVPYCIGFQNKNNQLVATHQTVSYLNFEMTTGFCQSTKQFCYDNKLAIKISHPKIKIRIPEELTQYIKINENNWKSFNLGVKSVNETFQFGFYIQQDFQIEAQITIKLTIAHQYRRSKKVSYIIRQQLLKIRPGDKQKALQSEALVLRKEIEQKLRKKFNEDNFEDYECISKKMQKLQVIEKIDNQILAKFNKKKAIIQQYDKNTDKLNKDKRAIESRRKETYNKRKYSEQDIFN